MRKDTGNFQLMLKATVFIIILQGISGIAETVGMFMKGLRLRHYALRAITHRLIMNCWQKTTRICLRSIVYP
jgi:hypothetical protein